MSRFYKSDRTGLEIAPGDHKTLTVVITVSSTYLDEPIEYAKKWYLTAAEYDMFIGDAVVLKNAIQQAAVAFMNAVEET